MQIPFDIDMEIPVDITIDVDLIHKRTHALVAVVKHGDIDGICGDLMTFEKLKLLDDLLCVEDYNYY